MPGGAGGNNNGFLGFNYLHSGDYYAKCCIGGVLACGVTHAAVVTLDVHKCRAQAHSKAGRWPKGLVPGIRKIFAEEGASGAIKGVTPTFVGYGAQGFCKFGFNEYFKDYYTHLMGADWVNGATWRKMAIWGLASGSAEVFADVALCPFEMTKVKMQVTLPGTEGAVSNSFMKAMSEMNARKAETKFPFGSLVPLWGRQVPYTMIKFVGFYQTQEMVYSYLNTAFNRPKASISEGQQLAITFGCGYWAGIFCAIATQPMDNLVSMKGIAENKNKSWGAMASEMGTVNLFTKGLGTRIIMIGTLTGLQWWIYGSFKSVMGFGTS